MSMELGDVGTHFQYENEHVKAWSLILEPGEASPWHKHTMHYLFIVTEPGTLRAELADGSSSEREYSLGEVVMGQKDAVHRVINTGDKRYSNAIVELKH